ncbi:hypothetical protein VMCG_08902 [Cytospora schulzeri]|uniref:C2H2-type domain-containing protein n=1 Tax=Cytospora schulzeri TaxID=448051 RepID=A0A423VUU2_9PEZI|nr:hypothetical protein VMCG_08902 [Valsa malicola]
MDANERLAFINRLNGLTGDQAREILKQMTINCNTKQTTIARALRNAVDHHVPVQYLAPVAVQTSPPFSTPRTVARSATANVCDKGNISVDSNEGGGHNAMPASKLQKLHEVRRGDINPDPNIGRLILDNPGAKRESVHGGAKSGGGSRRGALASRSDNNDYASPTTDKGGKPNTNHDWINKEHVVVVIDSDSTTSDSDTSESDTSDDDTSGENSGPTNAGSNNNIFGSANSVKDEPSSDDSESDTTDTNSSDSESSESEDIDMCSRPRQLPQSTVSSQRTARHQDERAAPVTPAQVAKSGVDNIKGDVVSSQASVKVSAEARYLPEPRKRKAVEHGEVEHSNIEHDAQENKRVKTSEGQRPVENRTCRKCLRVYQSRTLLFRHLQLRRHFDVSPTKPQSARTEVDIAIKEESDDQMDSP